MTDEAMFAEWIVRVRGGDADAAAELVRRYERAVRVAVRVRLTSPTLRRQFDSMDVFQSVMSSFFVRVAAGQFELTTPGQLIALLMKMAKNKLLMQARRHEQQMRAADRVEALAAAADIVDARPGPATVAAARELLAALLSRLTPDEQRLARGRAAGLGWAELATERGEAPHAARMRLSRAIARVAPELGLDAADE